MEIIGRKSEIRALREYTTSERPEFLVVYGRRRVGKTYLVREFFANSFCFSCTGMVNEDSDEKPSISKARQLAAFNAALNRYGSQDYESKDNWFESFCQLEHLVEHTQTEGKKVIFIDEMPWLDTPRSDFLSALEHFWNSFAAARSDVLLIACGSATSWIAKKLFENTGGLFNRVTKRMHLKPFSLGETEEFFTSRGIVLNRYQMVESYMVFGGIPFYLDLFDRRYGLAQNIDLLCFGADALLKGEYKILFSTLFREPILHQAIVAALAGKASGLTREEVSAASGAHNNGRLTEVLEELEECGFLRRYRAFGKKSKGSVYQLADPFVLFYHRFMKSGEINDTHYWVNSALGGSHSAWSGYAFEQVCLAHVEQIRKALGIAGVVANVSAWRSTEETNAVENTNHDKRADAGNLQVDSRGAQVHSRGAQVDLIIDRADQIINLCEMKYSLREFEINKSYAEHLEMRARLFREQTKTQKALHTTFVTTYGVKRNKYYHAVTSEVTMTDLFD